MDKKFGHFDLEYLAENGNVRPEDAQNFHISACRMVGVTDSDEVIRHWNSKDPESPWGSDRIGKQVQEVTELVCAFMSTKVKEAGGPDLTMVHPWQPPTGEENE